MKSKRDPRHLHRIKEMQALFAYSCGNKKPVSLHTRDIIVHLAEIDKIIAANAPKWPLDKINKIDLAILRLALWELLIQKKNPPKVIIDEAVEIAKEFGTDTSFAFVNGVIGSALKNVPISQP
ncbi:MAG TPA: transcription antitermination factor NusB [Candidatus Woesebacteria bacterium]|nr:transcription antitermination factor NusB [Candidatus Woesebacteria bacterium]